MSRKDDRFGNGAAAPRERARFSGKHGLPRDSLFVYIMGDFPIDGNSPDPKLSFPPSWDIVHMLHSGRPLMKKAVFIFVIPVVTLLFSLNCRAEAPRRIAGFLLGADVSQYKDQLSMDTALPVRHSEYLTEVDIKPVEGYKSGYVTFGNCEQPGRIARIKLKYERDEKEFFDELMERFGKKFGKPSEYKGDAFRACIAWKWTFTDNEKNKISLILQHNCQDEDDYLSGNAVKMSLRSLMEKERRCYESKHPELSQDKDAPADKKAVKKVDFRNLIPE